MTNNKIFLTNFWFSLKRKKGKKNAYIRYKLQNNKDKSRVAWLHLLDLQYQILHNDRSVYTIVISFRSGGRHVVSRQYQQNPLNTQTRVRHPHPHKWIYIYIYIGLYMNIYIYIHTCIEICGSISMQWWNAIEKEGKGGWKWWVEGWEWGWQSRRTYLPCQRNVFYVYIGW